MVKILKIKRSSFSRVLPLLAFFTFCLLSDSITVQAQQTRIAYIDASKLLKRMPEATDAQLRLDQLSATWTKEANDMQSEITRKQSEYDRRKLIMTDAERSASEVDLQNLRKKLDDYRHQKFDENTGELWTQYAQLMKPAYDRLENAIKEVALDGKYDYVLDRSSKDVALLYTNSKFDLTIPVARKLGIESEILTTPLVNNGPKSGMKPNQPGVPGANPGAPGANPGAPSNNPFPNPGNQGLTPNNGTSTQPGTPGYNSGGYNPDQVPPVVTKKP
jgi:outer membrane protein